MRKYEIMYILDAAITDEQRNELIAKLHGIITAERGKVLDVNEWGVREFAYPIKHLTKGYYVVAKFEAEPADIMEFERIFKIDPAGIRQLVVNLEE